MTPAEQLLDAARRLMARESPWLAVSPPRYNEQPICFGCAAPGEAHPTMPDLIYFVHTPNCAALDLVEAVHELEDVDL